MTTAAKVQETLLWSSVRLEGPFFPEKVKLEDIESVPFKPKNVILCRHLLLIHLNQLTLG